MEIKRSKDERISALLQEAIALHNEVRVRLGSSSNGGSDLYQSFINVVCNYNGIQILVLGSLPQIFKNHPDLLDKFRSFLCDSRHQATSFSETVPLEDEDDPKALESQTVAFLKKLRSRIGDDGVDRFVIEFHYDSSTRGLEETTIKCAAENCMREFPDLMEEFDDIFLRYMEVDRIFLRTHEGMNHFNRLMKYAIDKYQRVKTRNPCVCPKSADQMDSWLHDIR